jgi:ATP-dependent Clp protease ATP-binding subunit ClpB
MTSNLGSGHIVEAGPSVDEASWGLVEAQVREELRRHFRPEFLNRVDDIIVFRQLTQADLGRIVELQLAKLTKQLAARGIGIDVQADARTLLVEQGYDPVYGARPLKRVIQRLLQNPLALAVLEGDYTEGDTIVVRRSGDALNLSKPETARAKSA